MRKLRVSTKFYVFLNYYANYYYEKGGIIIKGEGDKPLDHRMTWMMFFPESVWISMNISCLDEVYDDNIPDHENYLQGSQFKQDCINAEKSLYGQINKEKKHDNR